VISSEVAVIIKKEKDLNLSSKFLLLLNTFMSEKKLEYKQVLMASFHSKNRFIILNKLSAIIVVVLAPMIQMMLNNVLLVVVKVSSLKDIKLDQDSSNKFKPSKFDIYEASLLLCKLVVTDAKEKEKFSHLLATSARELK